jgi:hypothetical protein
MDEEYQHKKVKSKIGILKGLIKRDINKHPQLLTMQEYDVICDYIDHLCEEIDEEWEIEELLTSKGDK